MGYSTYFSTPVASHSKEINYVYDLIPEGLPLRKFLERNGQRMLGYKEEKHNKQPSQRKSNSSNFNKRVKSEVLKPTDQSLRKRRRSNKIDDCTN